MSLPLMPLATAVWLVQNTALTFKQISHFCAMHEMEIQSIADGEIAANIKGRNPILLGQISAGNLAECENDPEKALEFIQPDIEDKLITSKTKKYIPIAKRRDKPDAVAWVIKNYPDIPDNKIAKLIGTTKLTIEAIRSRTHSNIQQIQPRDPVLLGICSQTELNKLAEKAESLKESKA
ncbi:MAG: DUF1013 domain-containing protein [Rickettsiales bacterium]|jgi:uncharacterized protein|nr:DUF1013 domain-containing protein [Rickettsiales bacterium]